MCAPLICFTSKIAHGLQRLRNGLPGVWKSRFQVCYALFTLSGVRVPGLYFETAFNSALCSFQEQVPALGQEVGREGQPRQVEPSLHLHHCRYLHNREFKPQFIPLHCRYPKHLSYEPNHSRLPLWSMERMREMVRKNKISFRISSGWDEPRSCCLLPLNQKLAITSPSLPSIFTGLWKKNCPGLRFKYLTQQKEGNGSFLMGSWSKWIIVKHFF